MKHPEVPNSHEEELQDTTPVSTTEKFLEESAYGVACELVRLAKHSESDNLRFKASTYLLDRVLGPANKQPSAKRDAPWKELIESFQQ